MPEIPTLTIFDPSGTERATLAGISAERTRHVTESGSAEFVVDRAEWQTVASDINERADRFRIDADGETGWFGGRFRDTERGGQTVTVILDDFERDARDAQPTGGQVLFQNVDDATVVQDALSRIPTLSPGTIETVASGLSFSFANAEPAKMIRDAAQPGGALVRYNADRTVDFLARPPADGSQPELSTAAETLVGEPDVSDDSRNPPTEIIGLGAQSGPNQVRATTTVDPDAAREVYRRYENKDIQQVSRLQTTVDRLADEVAAATEKLDIETEAVSLAVAPGDPVDFVLPAGGINATLRVIEFTETVTERGRRYAPLRVSNRWPEQGGADKAVADLERFNRGFQGFVDRDNFRAVERQPVDSSLAATGEYPYPDDVITEVDAKITVRSLPYRSYVSSGGHDHSFSIGDHNHDVQIATSETTDPVPAATQPEVFAFGGTKSGVSFSDSGEVLDSEPLTDSGGSPISGWPYVIEASAGVTDTETAELRNAELFVQAPNVTGQPSFVIAPSTGTPTSRFTRLEGTTLITRDFAGEELELRLRASSPDANSFDITYTFLAYAVDPHTHDVDVIQTVTSDDGGATSSTTDSETALEPGVVESFPDAPGANANGELLASGVDVVINGSTVASDIGSGEFTQTVDIGGDLSAGVNDIEVTSDSLGLVSAYVQTELFRQGPEDTI